MYRAAGVLLALGLGAAAAFAGEGLKAKGSANETSPTNAGGASVEVLAKSGTLTFYRITDTLNHTVCYVTDAFAADARFANGEAMHCIKQ